MLLCSSLHLAHARCAGKPEQPAPAPKPAAVRPPPQALRPPQQPRGPSALNALDKARRTHNENIRADGKVFWLDQFRDLLYGTLPSIHLLQMKSAMSFTVTTAAAVLAAHRRRGSTFTLQRTPVRPLIKRRGSQAMHYRRAQFLLGHMKVLQPFITPQAAARIRCLPIDCAPGV